MPLLLAIDLGTTKTTCIGVNAETGRVVARATQTTAGRLASSIPGRSEWDSRAMIASGLDCIHSLVAQPGIDPREVLGLGITGQQHGSLVVAPDLEPLTSFFNWQDQRGRELATDETSWLDVANRRLGSNVRQRTGCRINTGFLGMNLFWLSQNDQLPSNGFACFLTDLFAALLTGEAPVTEPTCAGGSGLFDVANRSWDEPAIAALELPRTMFPRIQEATTRVGQVTATMSERTGLPAGLPVMTPIGDHQASFLGSVKDRHYSLLINVGTGAQAAMFTPDCRFEPPIELRPFPVAGNLLSNVGLPGGWSYQVLENFYRAVGAELFGHTIDTPLYKQMTRLATNAARDSAGLVCVPTFSGTRSAPDQTGSLTGMTPDNLTPGNLTRSVLEGMAEGFRTAADQIEIITQQSPTRLVGAGNGLRENAVLAEIVELKFGLKPHVTEHREEAAFGAALIAGVGSGAFADLDDAAALIRYESD